MRIDDWIQIVNGSEKLYQNLVGVYHPSDCFFHMLISYSLLIHNLEYTNVAVYCKLASLLH